MERKKVCVDNTMSNDPIEDIKDTFIKNILNDIKSVKGNFHDMPSRQARRRYRRDQ